MYEVGVPALLARDVTQIGNAGTNTGRRMFRPTQKNQDLCHFQTKRIYINLQVKYFSRVEPPSPPLQEKKKKKKKSRHLDVLRSRSNLTVSSPTSHSLC